MAEWMVAAVGILYGFASAQCALKGEYWMGFLLGCYALASIALIGVQRQLGG